MYQYNSAAYAMGSSTLDAANQAAFEAECTAKYLVGLKPDDFDGDIAGLVSLINQGHKQIVEAMQKIMKFRDLFVQVDSKYGSVQKERTAMAKEFNISNEFMNKAGESMLTEWNSYNAEQKYNVKHSEIEKAKQEIDAMVKDKKISSAEAQEMKSKLEVQDETAKLGRDAILLNIYGEEGMDNQDLDPSMRQKLKEAYINVNQHDDDREYIDMTKSYTDGDQIAVQQYFDDEENRKKRQENIDRRAKEVLDYKIKINEGNRYTYESNKKGMRELKRKRDLGEISEDQYNSYIKYFEDDNKRISESYGFQESIKEIEWREAEEDGFWGYAKLAGKCGAAGVVGFVKGSAKTCGDIVDGVIALGGSGIAAVQEGFGYDEAAEKTRKRTREIVENEYVENAFDFLGFDYEPGSSEAFWLDVGETAGKALSDVMLQQTVAVCPILGVTGTFLKGAGSQAEKGYKQMTVYENAITEFSKDLYALESKNIIDGNKRDEIIKNLEKGEKAYCIRELYNSGKIDEETWKNLSGKYNGIRAVKVDYGDVTKAAFLGGTVDALSSYVLYGSYKTTNPITGVSSGSKKALDIIQLYGLSDTAKKAAVNMVKAPINEGITTIYDHDYDFKKVGVDAAVSWGAQYINDKVITPNIKKGFSEISKFGISENNIQNDKLDSIFVVNDKTTAGNNVGMSFEEYRKNVANRYAKLMGYDSANIDAKGNFNTEGSKSNYFNSYDITKGIITKTAKSYEKDKVNDFLDDK